MHVVELVDPGIGKFFKLPFESKYGPTPRYWTAGKAIYVGPVATVRFNLEEANSSGATYQLGPYNENSFSHDYVEGFIYGNSATVKYFDRLQTNYYVPLIKGGGTFVQADTIDGNGFHVYMALKVDCTLVSEIGYDIATFKLTCITQLPNFVGEDSQTIIVRLRTNRDPVSGQVNRSSALLTSLNGISKNTNLPLVYISGNNSIDIIKLLPQLRNYCYGIMAETRCTSPLDKLREKAIYDAIDNIGLINLNFLEGIKDLGDLKAYVQPLRDALKRKTWTNPINLIRMICSLHLWWRYIIKTGLMDMKDVSRLFQFVQSHQAELRQLIFETDMIGRGRAKGYRTMSDGSRINFTNNSKIYIGAFAHSIDSKLARLGLLGLVPTLSDLWDLLPFSFVLDWFLPIGDFIQQLYSYGTLQMLPMKCHVETSVHDRSINRNWVYNGITFHMDLYVESYTRNVYRAIPSLSPVLSLRDPRKQAITAGALLVNMITHEHR